MLKINKEIFIEVHLFLCLLLFTASLFKSSIVINFLFMVFSSLTIIWHRKLPLIVILSIFLLVIFHFQTLLLSNNTKFGYFGYLVSSIILGFTLYKFRVRPSLAVMIHLSVCVYILYHIITGSNLNEDVFDEMSRNTISIVALWLFLLVYFSGASKLTVFLLLTLTILISIASGSRSAIFSMGLLSLLYFSFAKTLFHRILLVVFLFVSSSYFFIEYSDALVVLDRLDSRALSDAGRGAVLSCYFEDVSLEKLVLGFNFGGDDHCGYKAIGTYALHNSFLSLQTLTGLGFYFILLLLIYLLFRVVMTKRYFLLPICGAFLSRSLTDDVLFFYRWDFIFWMLVFIIIFGPSAPPSDKDRCNLKVSY